MTIIKQHKRLLRLHPNRCIRDTEGHGECNVSLYGNAWLIWSFPHTRLVPLEPYRQHIPLYEEELVFGRHRGCSVIFTDLHVSKRHCRVFRTQTDFAGKETLSASQEERTKIFIEDLRYAFQMTREIFGSFIFSVSSNGTWINKKRLGKGHTTMLCHGDTVDLLMTKGVCGGKNNCVD